MAYLQINITIVTKAMIQRDAILCEPGNNRFNIIYLHY